ncbi:MAG TPA: hypothetical protein VM098_07620 [Phycisphaerae bacterium]|nr:hypothetical protein [Phycisphaerae bacterium]
MQTPPTDFDGRLLGLIERRVPLVRRPYVQIAAQLGAGERQVLDRLAALRGEGGLIREIAGIFDAAVLGYSQVLVALRVKADSADAAGRLAAEHPGVSHCYKRTGSYNVWLTLATSPESTLGLEKTAAVLSHLCGADSHMVLPALKRYKLLVRFSAPQAGENQAYEPQPAGSGRRPRPGDLADDQLRAVRALQMDLPNEPQPFAALAATIAMEADELLVHGADFLAAGWMRRYAAVLHHRAAGAAENVLTAWRVAPADADRAGAICASRPQVSHCYLRPPAKDWPYTLYTMIHGRDRAECERVIADLAASAALADRAELWTAAEFKKQRVRLFGDEEPRWEAEHR